MTAVLAILQEKLKEIEKLKSLITGNHVVNSSYI